MRPGRNRYYSLNTYLKSKFKKRVQKVPLDAGLSCPNRDGTISRSGCSFCNPAGSGTGLLAKGYDLKDQWEFLTPRLERRYKTDAFMAYFQSYTNTHCDLATLEKMVGELSGLKGLAGVSIGTRPDCLDHLKLEVIASLPVDEIWLDMGLQSAKDQTLKRINRGHTAKTFAKAAEMIHGHGLNICAHAMAGLPGEDRDDFLETIDFINKLPVQGIKMHNLYVCRGTALERDFLSGAYRPVSKEEYVEDTVAALVCLRPDMIVHRINGDPAPGELVAPNWVLDKNSVLNSILGTLISRDLWQGKENGAKEVRPEWFGTG